MERQSHLFFGIGLVLFGLFYLLVNLHVLYVPGEWFALILFAGAAGFFFRRFYLSKGVGMLIVASVCAYIAFAVFVDSFTALDPDWLGVVFFWGMSALFAYGFLQNSRKWGLLLLSGVFFTLGGVVVLDMLHLDDGLTGAAFFMGLALTFGVLFKLGDAENNLYWARVPAIVLALFSVFVFLVSSDWLFADIFFPLVLIAAGAVMLYRGTHTKRDDMNLAT